MATPVNITDFSPTDSLLSLSLTPSGVVTRHCQITMLPLASIAARNAPGSTDAAL